MTSLRTRPAQVVLVLVAVALNTFLALVVLTFVAGERVTAVVEGCGGQGRAVNCVGTWVVDGETRSGEVVDASTPGRVRAVVGPIGTYLDRPSTALERIVPPVVIDLVAATVVGRGLLLSRRGRPDPLGRAA